MKGIVYTGDKGAEVLSGIEVRDPGPGEVIVKIMAAGVCHSDITAASGAFGWPAPAVLGHEGAGIVDQIGTGVTNVEVGDHIIVSTLAACGMCKACGAGKPTRCRLTLGNMAQPFTLDGEACWNFAGASVFTERTVIKAIQAVKIPDDVPFTSACLVGCGVMTGAGAVMYRSNVEVGQTAVVYGCGGVGLSAVLVGVALGARVVAIDPHPAALDRARQLGAEHCLSGGDDAGVKHVGPVPIDQAVRDITDGGAHVTLDAVGSPVIAATAVRSLRRRGRHVQVGLLLGEDAMTALPMNVVIAQELEIYGSHGMAAVDYPAMLELITSGLLQPERLIGSVIGLEEAGEALAAMDAGTTTGITVIDLARIATVSTMSDGAPTTVT